jgi:hypothetical protein
MFQSLVDSLDKVYKYKTNNDPYMTSLSGKLYLGAHLKLTKGIGVGFLSRFQMIDKSIRPQYTFSLNLTPGKYFSTSVSYTLVDGIRDNLGFGTTFKLGPFHWYLMSDRIPLFYLKDKSGIPIPKYYKSFNLRTGFNLVFGTTRHRKIFKDKPLVEIED